MCQISTGRRWQRSRPRRYPAVLSAASCRHYGTTSRGCLRIRKRFCGRPAEARWLGSPSEPFDARPPAGKPGTLWLVTLSIEIPEATLRALGPSPSEAEGRVRLAAAMKLHELGHLSAGAAADLAGIPKVEFLHKLADHGVDAFRVMPAEFDQDHETLRRSLG